MRFAFTDEQLLFRDSVRDLLAKECPPEAVRRAASNDTGRVPGLWNRLAEMGIVGLTVPEADGGLGLGELDLVLLFEEMGRAASPEPLLGTTAVGAPLLRDLGDAELSRRFLGKVAAGEALVAVGFESMPYVEHADVADLLLLQHGDEVHAISRDTRSRIELTPHRSADGTRRLFSIAWTPGSDTLVVKGDIATRALSAAFDRGALAAAAELVGLARRVLDMTVEYVKVRQQFGKPVGSFQAVKHHLADALVAIELARPVVYRAAYAVAHREEQRSLDVSMAKARASDAALLASRKALQCHGAIGYTVEYDLQLWMKRAWALAAAWGDAAWHRARVGTFVLDGRMDFWAR